MLNKLISFFNIVGLKVLVILLLTPMLFGVLPFWQVKISKAAASNSPVGVLEAVDTSGNVTGWAFDPDDITQSVTVRIYIDVIPGSGSVSASGAASISRDDVGPHGFSIAVPAGFHDGNTHNLYAYAVDLTDASGSSDATLDGSPTAFTLAAVQTAPTISSFTASPSSIIAGQSSVLSWAASGATSFSVDNSVGTVTGSSQAVSPAQTTTYTLTATNSSGSVTKTATVTVSVPAPAATAPIVTSFAANPSSITVGQSSVLSWAVTSTTTATFSIDNGIGTVTGNSQSVVPSQTTTYIFTAVNSSGTTTAQITVTVSSPAPAGGGGGGSSGGGGGGGGSYIPPVSTPIPVSTSTPTSTTTLQPHLLMPGNSGSNFFSVIIHLIKQSGTYYIIQGSQKQGITSPGILYTYGLDFNQAKEATADEINLATGSILLPADGSLVKSVQDRTVYLVSNGQRFPFVSSKVFLSLGYKFSSVLVVTNPELQALPLVASLDDSTKAHLSGADISYKGVIYWISGGVRYPYPSLASYNSWHRKGNFSNVVPANSADLQMPIGTPAVERLINRPPK